MSEARFKLDLKQLANSALVHNLSQQINLYEKRVKELVHEFDLRSRDARERSKVQLDRFAAQLKRTRADLEKRVTYLLNQEGKRFNQGFSELVTYLKQVTATEKVAEKAAPVKRSASRAAKAVSGKTKKVAKSKVASRAKRSVSKTRSSKSENLATA